MLPSEIGWGILGAGKIARTFTGDLLGAGLRVTAVGSRGSAKADDFAASLGVQRAFGSYEELVACEDVDVVYIATPQPFHANQAVLAIEAGKAVLVEKSFTSNAEEARRVVEAARAHKVFVMEAIWTRFLPTNLALRAEIAEGAIGPVSAVTTQHFQRLSDNPAGRHYDPKLGGGVMTDLGVYGISYALDLLGDPTEVVVRGTETDRGVDTAATVLMTHPNDATSVTLTRMDAPGPNRAAIIGTEGWIELDPYWFTNVGYARYDAGRPGSLVRRFDPPPSPLRGMHFQALEVERCLLAGELESPDAPLDQSVRVMSILDLVRREIAAHGQLQRTASPDKSAASRP